MSHNRIVRSEVGVQVLIELLLEQFVFWIIFEIQVGLNAAKSLEASIAFHGCSKFTSLYLFYRRFVFWPM